MALMAATIADGNKRTAALTDRAFFEHLLRHGSSSRSATASAIGISRPTATEAVNRLLERQLIREAGTVSTNRGPAAIGYEINPDAGHSCALSIEAEKVRLSCWSLSGHSLFNLVEPLTPHSLGEDTDAGEEALQPSGASRYESIYQLFDTYRQEVTTPCLAAAVSLTERTEVTQELHTLFPEDIPILVDHNVNWAAIAEQHHGQAAGIDDALLVHVGHRVDAALILNGHLHRGRSGMAGELGFTRNTGQTLMQRINRLATPQRPDTGLLDPTAISEALSGGSPVAYGILRALAESIANVCVTVDPALLILTGPLAEVLNPRLFDMLLDVLLKPDIEMCTSALGEGGPHLGAEELAHRAALANLWAGPGEVAEVCKSVF